MSVLFALIGAMVLAVYYWHGKPEPAPNTGSNTPPDAILDDVQSILRTMPWSAMNIGVAAADVRLFLAMGEVDGDGVRIIRFSMPLPEEALSRRISESQLEKLKKLLNLALVHEYNSIRYCTDLEVFKKRCENHPALINGILVDNLLVTDYNLIFEIFEVSNAAEIVRAQQILRRLNMGQNARTRGRAR